MPEIWTTVCTVGEWKVQTAPKGDGKTYRIVNEDEDGRLHFYGIHPGGYGEPLVVEEPHFGLHVPENCKYVDHGTHDEVEPEFSVVGFVCLDKSGRVRSRFSLTSAWRTGTPFEMDDQGNVTIDGSRYVMRRLLEANSRRIRGYIGVVQAEVDSPEVVDVVELQDLAALGLPS